MMGSRIFPVERGKESHEIIKCLSETFLTNCFVYFKDNEWKGINAKVNHKNGSLTIEPLWSFPGNVYVCTDGYKGEIKIILTTKESKIIRL